MKTASEVFIFQTLDCKPFFKFQVIHFWLCAGHVIVFILCVSGLGRRNHYWGNALLLQGHKLESTISKYFLAFKCPFTDVKVPRPWKHICSSRTLFCRQIYHYFRENYYIVQEWQNRHLSSTYHNMNRYCLISPRPLLNPRNIPMK